MHESSLVQGLLKLVEETAARYVADHPGRKMPRIKTVTCEAGLLAAFEPETLKACFEIFREGTVAEAAQLEIFTAALDCQCEQCGAKFQLKTRRFLCPHCGGEQLKFSGGNGLTLTAIGAEDDPHG